VVAVPTRDRTRPYGDEGFTLAELLVVIALMGIVLSAAYMFVFAASAGQAVADREATLSRAVTTPFQIMERLIMQNSAIDPLMSPSPYRVTILTDQNADDTLEQHTFEAVRDSSTGQGYVNLVTYLTDSSGARVGAPRQNGHIAFDNANIRDSVPLFLYYDKDGVEITDMGAVSQQARSVVVQLRVTIAGVAEKHTDTIEFRNR
jgi:prepilin-type N-terminal cleavage/methylation domain-containing protein